MQIHGYFKVISEFVAMNESLPLDTLWPISQQQLVLSQVPYFLFKASA